MASKFSDEGNSCVNLEACYAQARNNAYGPRLDRELVAIMNLIILASGFRFSCAVKIEILVFKIRN